MLAPAPSSPVLPNGVECCTSRREEWSLSYKGLTTAGSTLSQTRS